MKWLLRAEALSRLRVKPQTLYAYVSRGQVRARPDPADGRRSLYNAADIDALCVRKARGRRPASIAASSMAWGEPSIETELSAVRRGSLSYRGRNATELARNATLEEVAALLWDLEGPLVFPSAEPVPVLSALAAHAAAAGEANGKATGDLSSALTIVGSVAAACGAAKGRGPLHLRLAEGWQLSPADAEPIRRALVLMADHDLNASTFACRVVASTGASLAASVLAAYCAFTGPKHGGAPRRLRRLLNEAKTRGAEAVVVHAIREDGEVPGFGHPLYPEGDPRAALLLEGHTLGGVPAEFLSVVARRTGRAPNSDFALAVLSERPGWPDDAPFCLFLLGRTVGWCAHAMEQATAGTLIRPRGVYRGS